MKELNQIQTKLIAKKGQFNKFGGYKYRSCEDILAAVKPLLDGCKCTLVISDEIVCLGNRFYIKAKATITNASGESVSASAYAREEEFKKGMDAAQITGSASSYARKYALNGLLAIDDTKDPDSLNVNKEYTSGDEFNAYAKPAIEQAQTKEELKKIYEDYKSLQKNADFLAALSARRKELGI